MRRRGALQAGAAEDSIDTIADGQINQLKELREVSPDEEERIRERIRQNNAGRWLEEIRPRLVGKKTVPIEYFNRIVQENEQVIGYVANIYSRVDKASDAKNKQITTLQNELAQAQAASAGAEAEQANAKELKAKDEELSARTEELEARTEELKAKTEECKELDTKTLKLEQSIVDLRTRASEKYEEEQKLRRDLDEVRKRENNVKDLNREDQRRIQDLEQQLSAATKRARPGSASAEKHEMASKRDYDRLRAAFKTLSEDNAELKIKNKQLTAQLDDLKNINDTPQRDNMDRFVRDARAVTEAAGVNRQLNDRIARLQKQQWVWMSQIQNVEPRWWDQVEELKKSKGDLDHMIMALYERLGYDATNMDGETIATRLCYVLDSHTTIAENGAGDAASRTPIMPAILKTMGNLASTTRSLQKAAKRVGELEKELKQIRASPDGERKRMAAETLVNENEEVWRRVDERTQAYRHHRRALMSNIFTAYQRLMAAAESFPDPLSRNSVEEICEDYLSAESLPDDVTAFKKGQRDARDAAKK